MRKQNGVEKMKLNNSWILVLIAIIIFSAGCSSQSNNGFQGRQGMPPGEWQDERQFRNRTMNMTDEEMQQRFLDMQKNAEEACLDRNEGDECSVENTRGTMGGICKTQEDKLLCEFERPERPMRQDETN